ncbi:PQQ-binding-like beta-propeller repeat protein [Streptomyces sp. TRM68367]|uniref:serine/threonine-protein kinase n=1 Tax=Streptomyces sp. TRM68367 TaxID=2758415 RepID=UPI00165AC044|nr:serine/threonine-protein kinase [Streptomyces sp. TRM68367]MBC9726674.1 PQQ-binding-like beta-propeller repeat protein [Streptomyces sp. TRM68367]
MAPQRNTGAGAEAELPEFAGHYRLESCLGSGGMGVVHLARSTSGMKLAVKIVHAQFAEDPEFRGRFRQEVTAARRVSGAFTAPVVDADPEAERPWMATLFIPGSTLAEQVKRNGPMAPGQLRRLMAGLAEALRDIHRVGVVHRDLKPSNVLLAGDGPKVIDFGISRPKDSELRTETGKLIGTPPFMAPEQFRRPREVGPAADVFALGSVMVHAATGRGPFDSDSPYIVAYQVVHDEPDLTGVPEELAPVVLRCLAKEPEDRPTPDELMRELRSVAASYDTQAFVPSPRTHDTDEAEAKQPGEAGQPGQLVRPVRPGDLPEAADEVPRPDAGGSRAADSVPTPAPRTRRRTALAALSAGALALVAGTVFASVRLLDDREPAARSSGSATTASARISAWAVRPAPRGEGTPECSHGAGTLFCARSGVVFAVDPADGGLLWKHPVPKEVRSEAPVLSGGLVQPMASQGHRLEALDPASGDPRWQRPVPPYSGVTRIGGMLLLTGADGKVTAVDGTTGHTKWSRPIPGLSAPYFRSFPGSRLAYATSTSADGSRTRVTAVDPVTGDVRWTARLNGNLEPVGAHDGSVFFLSLDQVYGQAEAVVRYTRETEVTRRVPLPVPRQGAQAAVRGDVVYLVAAGGSVEAVDVGARKRLWSLEAAVSRGSRPVADARHVFVSAPDGRLLAVDAREGRLAGQTAPRLGAQADRVAATLPEPLIVDGRVYATAPDGTVFAVDARDPSAWRG